MFYRPVGSVGGSGSIGGARQRRGPRRGGLDCNDDLERQRHKVPSSVRRCGGQGRRRCRSRLRPLSVHFPADRVSSFSLSSLLLLSPLPSPPQMPPVIAAAR